MGRFAKAALLAVVAGGVGLGAVAPADAHIGPGGAIIAGLAGLGIGAAIASDHPHRYYGGYGGGYAYAPAPVGYGYAPPPPPPPAYYAPPPPPPSYGYEEVRECRVSQRWDGWQGRYVPVRRCW